MKIIVKDLILTFTENRAKKRNYIWIRTECVVSSKLYVIESQKYLAIGSKK